MSLTEVRDTVVLPFMEGLTQPSEAWRQFFEVRTDDVAAVKLASYSGIGGVPEWDGSNDISTADVNDRFNTSLSYTKYALQVRLNKYDIRDVPGLLENAVRKLGVAVANTYGSIGADRLEDVYDATSTAGDGVALISDSHPLASGGTRDNKLTSAFDRTAFMAAINLASLWKSYHGQEEDWSGDDLVMYGSPADSSLRENVHEVFRSVLSGQDNQANAALGYNVTPVIWAKLTDSTRWGIISRSRTPLVYWIRSGAEQSIDVDVDNRGTKITVDFAIGTQIKPDPVGIIGSDA